VNIPTSDFIIIIIIYYLFVANFHHFSKNIFKKEYSAANFPVFKKS
jgi:hypothetical protein